MLPNKNFLDIKKATVHIPAESTVAIFFWFKLNKTYDKERSVKLIPNSFKKYSKLISGRIYLISGRFLRFSVFYLNKILMQIPTK